MGLFNFAYLTTRIKYATNIKRSQPDTGGSDMFVHNNVIQDVMEKLSNLAISLCQMKVVPGRPDLNTAYIVREIESAIQRKTDIIVFPEMATTGYLIGDTLEDVHFVEDVLQANKRIIEATRGGITAIVGTIFASNGSGEDGNQRIHNAALVAHNGVLLGWTTKSLQPNYRFFNDDKHLYSLRKVAEEINEKWQERHLRDLLNPFTISTRIGDISLGVILCEDMWHRDYAFNPTKILAGKGVELVINLSASPWTWQKNRKRHQVVKDLLKECNVPFVYVNNTGTQNTGKNIIVFDGSSTVYNAKGDRVFEISPYSAGTFDMAINPTSQTLPEPAEDDTGDLYAAMCTATRSLVPPQKNIYIGLSGGIDSAVVAAHCVELFGKERVKAINMPFLNSQKTQDLALTIAENLGIEYEVIPIKDIVEATCRLTGVHEATLAYENVQARARKDILAAKAQNNDGVFTCNGNKIETAFGYGTLYGDIAGFYAPLGDLVKREVRQIARHLNLVRFKKEVIPEECIHQIPTAELAANQKDPFDYGDINRRGYHDELVRAFTEFRKNPEWILEMYMKGRLESEMQLELGTLARLFPTPKDFIADLRKSWELFYRAFFKRVQSPPIPVFSKRAFGRDLEESMMSPHWTSRFLYLEKLLLGPTTKKQRIVIYGASLNPPGRHHRLIVEALASEFDKVLVVPCGIRAHKPSIGLVDPFHRKQMALITFGDISRVSFDFYDLENNTFTPTWDLNEKYRKEFSDADIIFAVGGDLIKDGRNGQSEIQRIWRNGEHVWKELKFVILNHEGAPIAKEDSPPHAQVITLPLFFGRSSIIRERIAKGESIEDLVHPDVARYIQTNNLYR